MVCSWIAPLNMGGGALLREHCLSGCRRQLTDSRVCEREREREGGRYYQPGFFGRNCELLRPMLLEGGRYSPLNKQYHSDLGLLI